MIRNLNILLKKMGKLLENLKNYFENTPKDEIEKDLAEIEHLNEIGPDVLEYTEELRKYMSSE